jgi:PadR family transcriptional regulator PadR
MHEALYCRLGNDMLQDMSEKGHIVLLSNTNTNERTEMSNVQKEAQTKLTKGLLDLIVLQFLDSQPMNGYQIITRIRRSYGLYFGPSTVYPILASLEKKGHVESRWNMESERPRKVYKLTSQGKNLLDFTENSLNLVCKKMAKDTTAAVELSVRGKMGSTSFQKGTALSL